MAPAGLSPSAELVKSCNYRAPAATFVELSVKRIVVRGEVERENDDSYIFIMRLHLAAGIRL